MKDFAEFTLHAFSPDFYNHSQNPEMMPVSSLPSSWLKIRILSLLSKVAWINKKGKPDGLPDFAQSLRII
jgi:hypothetical protein